MRTFSEFVQEVCEEYPQFANEIREKAENMTTRKHAGASKVLYEVQFNRYAIQYGLNEKWTVHFNSYRGVGNTLEEAEKAFDKAYQSNGLHGEGFAVGWVVIDLKKSEEKSKESLEIVSSGYEGCALENPDPWVAENVLPNLPPPTQPDAKSVRSKFWEAWLAAKEQGKEKGSTTLWADCGWPVETNFLTACVNDDLPNRMWEGSYPLHEIATVLRIAGWDETAKYDRLPDEPAHHPTGDAKQSARMLLKAVTEIFKTR